MKLGKGVNELSSWMTYLAVNIIIYLFPKIVQPAVTGIVV